MKKLVALLLVCCMIITALAATANAQTRSGEVDANVAAVADKLDPSVIDCLYNAAETGNYFEIQYHGVSQSELLAQIGAITDHELVNVDIGEGKVSVGLPYSSIVRVAGLDSVDYISLFTPTYSSKIAQTLQAQLNNMTYGDVIRVDIWIYRERLSDEEKDRLAREEAGLPMDLDFEHMTPEEFERYLTALSRIESELETDVSKEFIEKYGLTEDEVNSHTFTSINANLSKARIVEFDTYPEVLGIYDINTIEPTEAPTEADDDFPGYPIDHWTNNVLIFCNTDGIFTSATVRYIEDGSGVWKSAQMTYGGKNEYNESFWYFTMPLKKCRYYITDGTHRTQEDYFTHETLLFLMNETDENGYYNLCIDSYAANEPSYLYRDKLKERYNLSELTGETMVYQLMSYNELYYHRDSSGEIDWALIQCYCNMSSPIDMVGIIGNRVLHPGTAYYPFETTYGIYDVKNDKFIDPSWGGQYYHGGKEAFKYDGFVRAFDEIVGSGMGWSLADVDNRGKGRPLGDIDNDYELSVVDVTMIQRCEASMMEYPATDELWLTYDYNGEHYYSDFNLDGERDIIDATSIQRYLAGMDYPIG